MNYKRLKYDLPKKEKLGSSGMIMSANISQNYFFQAKSINRKIGSSFEISADSFSMFNVIFLIHWVALYDRIILPITSRIMGKHVHFSTRKRMGGGMLLSLFSMIATAIVEGK